MLGFWFFTCSIQTNSGLSWVSLWIWLENTFGWVWIWIHCWSNNWQHCHIKKSWKPFKWRKAKKLVQWNLRREHIETEKHLHFFCFSSSVLICSFTYCSLCILGWEVLVLNYINSMHLPYNQLYVIYIMIVPTAKCIPYIYIYIYIYIVWPCYTEDILLIPS